MSCPSVRRVGRGKVASGELCSRGARRVAYQQTSNSLPSGSAIVTWWWPSSTHSTVATAVVSRSTWSVMRQDAATTANVADPGKRPATYVKRPGYAAERATMPLCPGRPLPPGHCRRASIWRMVVSNGASRRPPRSGREWRMRRDAEPCGHARSGAVRVSAGPGCGAANLPRPAGWRRCRRGPVGRTGSRRG
jgi:hypothetical protein